MGTNRSSAGKIIISVMLISSFCTGVNTYARSFQEYNGVILVEGGSNVSPEDRGRPEGPPPEAMESCDSLGESEACSFTSPRGDEINGTCEYVPGDKFACVPEGGPPGGRKPPHGDTPTQ